MYIIQKNRIAVVHNGTLENVEELREELKQSTVITIAHRTAAVRDADYAIVLANGQLSSFGPAEGKEVDIMDDEP